MTINQVIFQQIIKRMEDNNVLAKSVNLGLMNLTIRNLMNLNEALKKTQITETLMLNSNGLDDYRINFILESLASNIGLKDLNLADNNIDNAGAVAINNAILKNPNIPFNSFNLCLDNNLFDLYAAKDIFLANPKLKRVNLKNNFDGENQSAGEVYIYYTRYRKKPRIG